jgi:hypothetical protein
LGAAVGSPASPDAQQLVVGQRARDLHQVLRDGLRGGASRLGEEATGDQRDYGETNGDPAERHVGIGNTTPPAPGNHHGMESL